MDEERMEVARSAFLMPRSYASKDGNLLSLGGDIISMFRRALQKYGCPYAPYLLVAAKEAYDLMCNETDIPVVPAIFEAKIEQALWNTWIDPTLQSVVHSVCGV